jgi:hypothetical protein
LNKLKLIPSKAMKIHISSTTRDILETFGNFILEKRGEIELKVSELVFQIWI